MDVQARRNFWAQIHRYAGRGRTVLFATHYLHEADDAADRVVVIVGGRKVADGPPGAIKATLRGRQVRFTLRDGPPGLLGALAGVRAVDRDGPRVTLHSSDTDATVRLAGQQRAADGQASTSAAWTWRPHSCGCSGRPVMTGFVTLELRRCAA